MDVLPGHVSFGSDHRARFSSISTRSRVRPRLHQLAGWFMTRLRRTFVASLLLFLAAFCVFIVKPPRVLRTRVSFSSYNCNGSPAVVDAFALPEAVNGPPTARFRDNLRNDTTYITSWSNAGFTNEFMNYVNMIYLGVITDRVPIIPPFAPDHHVSTAAGIIPFGDIFDLDHLRKTLQIPILEWRDIKELPSRYSTDPYSTTEIEPLGCWTTRKENEENPIRAENVVHHLGIDVAYTRVPTYTRLRPGDQDDPHVVFSHLAALIYPQNPIASPDSFPSLAPSPVGHHLPPEEHLSCFDTMYYATSGAEYYEWRFSWSPVWRTVGRHLPFTQTMKDLGRQYLSKIFELEDGELFPKFIVVHVRRGDFSYFCAHKGREDCFPPLSAYEKDVDKIKEDLIKERGLNVSKVLVMSDEESPVFWDNVRSRRWLYVNHTQEQTLERFGEWYSPLIDVAIQTFAVGFVGTEDSTFSLVGERRVRDWNGGLTMNVNVRVGH